MACSGSNGFTATEATNRDVKNLLIKLFGEDVCIIYPKDRSKSEMFFSRSVTTEDLWEKRAPMIQLLYVLNC